jgi:hypothetical protein
MTCPDPSALEEGGADDLRPLCSFLAQGCSGGGSNMNTGPAVMEWEDPYNPGANPRN